MNQHDWCLVVNPGAAHGRCGQRWSVLEQRLRAAGCHFEASLTPTAGSVEAIVARALEKGCRRFLAVGGDGTLNQLVQALLHTAPEPATDLAIGALPLGSGNDWAAWRGLAVEHAPRDLARSNLGPIDVGRVEFGDGAPPRYFLNVAGCGLDGWLMERMQGKPHGHWRYLGEAVRGLFRFAPVRFRLDTSDDSIEERGLTTVVALGPRCGGGMRLAPGQRRPGDALECLLVRPITLPLDLPILGNLHNGRLSRSRYARTIECRSLSIETDRPVPVQLDGEPVGTTPCRITLLPRAMQGLLPAEAD